VTLIPSPNALIFGHACFENCARHIALNNPQGVIAVPVYCLRLLKIGSTPNTDYLEATYLAPTLLDSFTDEV